MKSTYNIIFKFEKSIKSQSTKYVYESMYILRIQNLFEIKLKTYNVDVNTAYSHVIRILYHVKVWSQLLSGLYSLYLYNLIS